MDSRIRLTKRSRPQVFWFAAALLISCALNVACVTAKMNSTSGGTPTGGGNTPTGSLTVAPMSMNFGSVTVGSSKNQTGSLAAASAGVTVSTASWNGNGFSVSGISFPVTIAAGQSVPFTVTFAPQVTGASSGTIAFVSDATTSAGSVSLSGTGQQTIQHSVTLNWNPSPSSPQGYYVYRGATSGGPYTRLSPLESGLSYVDTAVTSGQTYYYAVTAVGAGNLESAYSNEASAVIP
jgi:Abnormal spindle-like microcephaly-assoc'd, ASPM-SPD-2-Hydin